MLNKAERPQDYTIATEQCASVKEFATLAFQEVGYSNVEWRGEGVDEKLFDKDSGKVLLEVDKEFFRPGEVPYLRGSYQKIKQDLGWIYEKDWKALLKEMVKHDMLLAKRELTWSK